jgi:hypothetical protein
MWRLLDLGLRTGQCTFDEAHFEREYGNLEKAYYSSEIDYEAIAPLNGFVASGPIQLSNDRTSRGRYWLYKRNNI